MTKVRFYYLICIQALDWMFQFDVSYFLHSESFRLFRLQIINLPLKLIMINFYLFKWIADALKDIAFPIIGNHNYLSIALYFNLIVGCLKLQFILDLRLLSLLIHPNIHHLIITIVDCSSHWCFPVNCFNFIHLILACFVQFWDTTALPKHSQKE